LDVVNKYGEATLLCFSTVDPRLSHDFDSQHQPTYFICLGPMICLLPPIAMPLPAELPLFMLSPPV
jgi:hypothetical protein